MYRGQGKDVSCFEEIFKEEMGFFINSLEDLKVFIQKMTDYFEKNANIAGFTFELGKKISVEKSHADYAFMKANSNGKLPIFQKYRIHCINNCFLRENELWDGFLRENKRELDQFKSKQAFMRAFARWNESIDFDELKQMQEILNMKYTKSLAYGSERNFSWWY
jgi:hypothetical protein